MFGSPALWGTWTDESLNGDLKRLASAAAGTGRNWSKRVLDGFYMTKGRGSRRSMRYVIKFRSPPSSTWRPGGSGAPRPRAPDLGPRARAWGIWPGPGTPGSGPRARGPRALGPRARSPGLLAPGPGGRPADRGPGPGRMAPGPGPGAGARSPGPGPGARGLGRGARYQKPLRRVRHRPGRFAGDTGWPPPFPPAGRGKGGTRPRPLPSRPAHSHSPTDFHTLGPPQGPGARAQAPGPGPGPGAMFRRSGRN